MKKALVTAGILAAALTLQGCGGGGGGGGGGATTPAPTPAPTTTTAPAPTTKPFGPNPWCTKGDGTSSPSPPPGQAIGWSDGDPKFGGTNWCAVGTPKPGWQLNDFCKAAASVNGDGISVSKERFLSIANTSSTSIDSRPLLTDRKSTTRLKILTYNLYWWNLFKQRNKGDLAGQNMADYAKDEPYDLMGFQECEDLPKVLNYAKAAGLTEEYGQFMAKDATCLAYRKSAFTELERGQADVAEDGKAQWFGRRIVHWIRLKHTASGKTIFFMNHHGPTPVNSGGLCGPEGTAYNILKQIGLNAKVGDHVVLTGDFNAWSNDNTGKILTEIGHVACHLPHIFSNPKIDDVFGIDNIFASCAVLIKSTVMPKGGSDHNALNVVVEFTS